MATPVPLKENQMTKFQTHQERQDDLVASSQAIMAGAEANRHSRPNVGNAALGRPSHDSR